MEFHPWDRHFHWRPDLGTPPERQYSSSSVFRGFLSDVFQPVFANNEKLIRADFAVAGRDVPDVAVLILYILLFGENFQNILTVLVQQIV